MNDLKWAIAREIPHLRRYARALVGEPTLADDLVQDCLERGLRKRHTWRRTGSLRSWLFRILYTTYVNNRVRERRRGTAVDVERVDDERLAVSAPQHVELHSREVLAGVANLPDDQRAAILLVAVEGMSYDEVAAVLDVPIGTVRSRLWRGRETLRTLMSPNTTPVARLRRVK